MANAGDLRPTNPSDPPRMPSQKELLEMIDALTDITEEEKEEIRKEILRGTSGAGVRVEEVVSNSPFSPQVSFVFVLFLVMAVLIGWIAYKLIIKEKERTSKKEKRKPAKKKTGQGEKAANKKKAGKGN